MEPKSNQNTENGIPFRSECKAKMFPPTVIEMQN